MFLLYYKNSSFKNLSSQRSINFHTDQINMYSSDITKSSDVLSPSAGEKMNYRMSVLGGFKFVFCDPYLFWIHSAMQVDSNLVTVCP